MWPWSNFFRRLGVYPVNSGSGGGELREQAMGSDRFKNYDDDALVPLLQEGDEEAFSELMFRFKQRVFSVAYRYVGNYEDATDVAQEVFVNVYRSIDRFTGASKLSTWIYRIAANTAINRLRSRSRHGGNVTDSLDQMREDGTADRVEAQASRGPRPDESLSRKEFHDVLHKTLAELPEHYRMVFVLRETRQLSYSEIAKIVEAPVGTVKSRLNQARKRMRELLGPYLARGDI